MGRRRKRRIPVILSDACQSDKRGASQDKMGRKRRIPVTDYERGASQDKMGRKRRIPVTDYERGASQDKLGRKRRITIRDACQSDKRGASQDSTVVCDTFVWAKLRGCPMWPAKVVKPLKKNKVLCFVKSDDAEIPVSVTDIVPFKEQLNKLKNNGIGILKKKRQITMLNCFLSDVEWALWEIHEQESSTSTKSPASHNTGPEPDEQELETRAKSPASDNTGHEPDEQESATLTKLPAPHNTGPDPDKQKLVTLAKPPVFYDTGPELDEQKFATLAKSPASHNTGPERDKQESATLAESPASHNRGPGPDGQESVTPTKSPATHNRGPEPDGQESVSLTKSPATHNRGPEPDGHESVSLIKSPAAHNRGPEPDGQESVSLTKSPATLNRGPEPDGQESVTLTKSPAAHNTGPEADGQDLATSSDNECYFDSSGSEWVPRNSDASESSCEDYVADDRNNNCKQSVERQWISESSEIDENDSHVWPMLSKDCLMKQNSEEVCTINSQSLLGNSEKDVSKETNSDVSSEDESLDESSIERDVENPKFYIRAVLKSDITKTGKLKKKDRVYNAFQYCEVCDSRVSNFAQHMDRNEQIHKNCPEIMKLKKETDRAKRDALRNILRGKYNHRYNMKNLKRGHGEIILERRPVGKFHLNDFGPCPNCYLWVSKRLLKKHQKSCSAKKPFVTGSSSLITQSDTLSGRITAVASKPLVNEVFTKMKMDSVGKLAREDPLIIHLGNQWMQKNVGNKLKRGAYTSAIMRLVARLLLNLRKLKSIPDPCMSSYLKSEHFDTVCHATILTSASNMDDEEDLLKPSNALKLGFDLKRLADGKIGHALTSKNKEEREEAEDFLKMMQIFWGTRITKLARVILEQRKFGQVVHLPHPEDIKELYMYLQRTLAELDLKSTDFENYRTVCEAVEARLIVYNRRRTGEVQAVRVESYEKRRKGGETFHLMGQLTKFEKKLLETQEVMTVRGKTGTGVPIILPCEVHDALKYITDRTVRRSAGIKPDNTYLFASQGDGVFWGYDVLYKACRRANLSAPERITSTSLRKYMATLTQVLDLQPHQLQWVLNHMGHTLDVHKIYYRATSDVLERTQIAKILLLQDHDRIGEFKNKKLEDIQFTDLVLSDNREHEASHDLEPLDVLTVDIQEPEESHDVDIDPDNIEGALYESEHFDFDIDERQKKPKKRNAQQTKLKWTEEEEVEIKQLFRKYFENKTRPKPDFCVKAIRISKANNGAIYKRKKDVLKKKVFRMIDSLKKLDD